MAEEDIAIVGIGCRFPGADNIDEFWRVLLNGEDHVKEIPITRWKNEAFYDENQTVPGKMYVRNAGLLNNHDRWDNRLFGISDVEARRIDPQQRYVLECVHMALEDGGITRKQINGSNTGVFIGCMNNDYKAVSNSRKSDIGSYNTTSTSASLISARVSQVYNLQGTCLTLDTACSSALVAIHLASQTIQTGDCEMMICGGVSSILTPDTFVALCKARMLSPTGKCQSFCETADGYARGEGCGVVIIKTLKSALEDGNKVWAIIKTGSNQDGATTKPMTAPSAGQQINLLRQVYEKHKFDPFDIQYIEAHGTGTPRGDPTELNSLGEFFHSFRQTTTPIHVGSVKSNIGHTESAAGVAGLIKVLLMMKYGKYVPSLHVKENKSNVNKKIKLTEYGLDIVTSVRDWDINCSGTRHACLNSFGFGGSNSHAIITQLKSATAIDRKMSKCRATTFCISGLDQKALKLNLTQFQKDLSHFDNSLCDIASTSLLCRDIYPFRTLLHGNQISDLQQECRERIVQVQQITPHTSHNIVFVYCGEGTTWTGMGQTLMQENDVFIRKINEIDEHLEPLTGWKIGPKLASNSIYDDPELNIIAIFSIQVALTEVWRSLGVKPDKIIGQSIGEIAASYAANLLFLPEAIAVVYHMAKILSKESEGSMVVIGNINIEDLESLCEENKGATQIAVYNSPNSCTLSGNGEIIKIIVDDLKEKRKDRGEPFVRKLNVKRGYHSKLLKTPVHEITDRIDRGLSEVCTHDTKNVEVNDMISTVTNELLTASEIRNGSYWARNVLHPVLFMQSVKAAFDESCYNIFLELGPRPVLKPHLPYILEDYSKARLLASLNVNNENNCFHSSIKELFELGVNMHIDKLVVVPIQGEAMGIPRYTFNTTGDLFIPNSFEDYLSGSFEIDDRSHMFVENVNENDFRLCIDSVSTPFVFDHFLSNKIIVPGATYVEAGFYIGTRCLRKPANQLSVSFSFIKTCSTSFEKQIKLIVQFYVRKSNFIEFSILHDTKVLAAGNVSGKRLLKTKNYDIENLQSLCPIYKSKRDCYACLADLNFKYGKGLSLIEEAWLSATGKKCLTKMHFPEESLTGGTEKTHIHPAVIDAVFQIFGILEKESIGENHFVIPKGVKSVLLHRHIETSMFAYAEKVTETNTSTHYNAVLLNSEGHVIAEIIDFYTNILSSEDPLSEKSLLYEINWLETDSYKVKDPGQAENLLLVSNHPESVWLREFCKTIRTQKIQNIEDLHLRNNLSDKDAPLIYHVGTTAEKITRPMKSEAHDDAVKRFMDLKNLISENSESKQLLAIITENTQICPERKTINIIGSELWGMIRSAFHEGALKNVKLIDIDPENIDITILIKALFSTNDNEHEYAISGTKVYRPRLVATRRKKMPFRHSKADEFKDLAICVKDLSNIEDRPYLSYAPIEKPLVNSLRIRLQSFTVHDKAIYPYTSPHSMYLHIIDGQMDGQMLALEGVGSSENGQTFMFLFPVHARTYVHVPNDFLIKSTFFKRYVSGMLMLLHTLVQLASEITEYSEVAIIRNTGFYDTGQQILHSLVKEKYCTVSFFTMKELRGCKKLVQANKLIIARRFSFKHLLLCLRHFQRVEEIISFKAFAPEDLPAVMSQLFPQTKLKLLNTSEFFHFDKIRQTMPVIKTYLNHLKYKDSDMRNRFVLPLPMKTLDIREQMFNKDLNLYSDESTLFRPDSCYIVTGGASGLGWELLQLMVEKGAGLVVNFSRRNPSNIVQEHMDNLAQRFSCRIISLKVDVSDIESVNFGFNKIQKYFPNFTIKGIFHGAAVTSDSILEQLQEDDVYKVMRPKVLGALNLHQASLNFSLDYFVLHSSIVSVLGNPGQCNYAAANSFLDTFAHYRRFQGHPAQSINWGPLSVGLAVENDEMKSILEKKGFKSIGTETIKDIFIEALINDSTNSVYSDIEWGKMLSMPTFQKQTTKFANFLNKEKLQISKFQRENNDIDRIHCLGKDEQKRQIKAVLKGIICSVLVIEKDTFSDDMSLTEIGLDSMASMSLSNGIHDAFGCRIPVVTLLSDSSSLSSIVEVVRTNFICKNAASSDDRTDNLDVGYNDLIIDTETRHLFLSDSISFMQNDLLSRTKNKRNSPYDLRVIDMEMKDVKCTIDEWKAIFALVMKMHPELRKRFISTENELSGEILQEKDAVPEIIEVDETDFRNPDEKDVRKSISLNVFESLPVSFRIAHTRYGTLIRMILHAVVFDMRSLSMICKTIEWAGSVVVKQSKEPYEQSSVKVTDAVRKVILPRMRDLGLYWKQYLNADIHSLTLGKTLHEVDEAFCCIQRTKIPPEIVSSIKMYVSKIGISIYEFFMSLYQLFLFIGSGSNKIVVGTAADMRFHVPDLNHVVTRCTNYIPVIAYIDKAISLSEFIKHNGIRISDTTKHGAYPSSLILKYVKTDETRANIFRHFMSINDMKYISKLMAGSAHTAEIKKIWHTTPTRETFIYVRYDLQNDWIQLETGYNSEICGVYGEQLPNKLMELVCLTLNNDNKTISEVRDELIKKGQVGEYEQPNINHILEYSDFPNTHDTATIQYKDIVHTIHNEEIAPLESILESLPVQGQEKKNKEADVYLSCNDGENEQFNKESFVKSGEHLQTLLSGQFLKQTAHGWDHKVNVILYSSLDGKTASIQWGKERKIRKVYRRILNLSEVRNISLRRTNGISSITIVSKLRNLVLKTSNKVQAQEWFEMIESLLQPYETRIQCG